MDKKRFGVIGVGTWGQTHVETYIDHPQAELVAISDTNQARLQQVASEHGVQDSFTDYHQLLGIDEIDAVSIVTLDFAHTEAALAALDAGKHVLIEKPMATTTEDCAKIRERAEA